MQARISASDIRNTYERDGFVVLPDFLPPTILTAANDEIDKHYASLGLLCSPRAARQHADNFAQFECDVVSWNPCGDGVELFLQLRDDWHLSQVTAACIGERFQATESLVMFSQKRGRGQAWHQDCPPEDMNHFNLNRLFYTRDVTLEDGAVVVVPGSHRLGRIPPGGHQETIEGEKILTPRAGTLILLSGHVFHRVTPNLSGKPRVSVNFRAYAQGVSPDVCRVGVYRNGAYDFDAVRSWRQSLKTLQNNPKERKKR